ncbi:MAG: sodium/solute symporter [bacterium]|nr:sodium/solute symporter [bacterium]
MTLTGYCILAAYLFGLLGIGVYFSRRQRSVSDFFVAGRSIPAWAALAAIVATETSAVTFIGAPAMTFNAGGDFSFLQIILGYILARAVIAAYFLPKFFEHEIVTIYQYLGRRFGARVQRASGYFFFFTRAMAAGVRHFAAAVVIQAMTGWDVVTAIWVTGVFSLFYAALGGLSAVIWTEVAQFTVMILGGLFIFTFLSSTIDGGLPAIIQAGAEQGKFTIFHWDWSGKGFLIGLLGGFTLNLATHGADQDLVQRLLSCRDLRSARVAMVASGFVVFALFAFLLFVGVMFSVFYGGLPEGLKEAHEILPYFSVHEMSPAAGAFVLAAVLSAAMSSTASALNSLSSTTVTDFILPYWAERLDDRARVRLSRGITLGWTLVLITIALVSSTFEKNILDLALSVPSFTFGSLLAMFLLGIFTRFQNQRAAVAGMVIGVAPVIALSAGGFYWTWFVPAGACSSIAAAYVIDLFWKEPSPPEMRSQS